jgi:hypothetical protein
MFAEQDSNIYPVPGQQRAGSPYACVGNCNVRKCLGGLGLGTLCNSSSDCYDKNTGQNGVCIGVGICSNTNIACTKDSDCNPGFCIGGAASNKGSQAITSDENIVNDETINYFAQSNIMRLFAESFGVFKIKPNGKYEEIPGLGWTVPKTTCPTGHCSVTTSQLCGSANSKKPCPTSETCESFADGKKRRPGAYQGTSLQQEYCAIPPIITNAGFGDDFNKTVQLTEGSGNVELKFTVVMDPEQVPIVEAKYYWGDDTATEAQGLSPLAPKSSKNNPHTKTHVYFCSPGSANYDPNANECVFRPKLLVKDNWGWCNNGVDNAPCNEGDKSTWYPANLNDELIVRVKL